MNPNWHFFGTARANPTVGELIDALNASGMRVEVREPVFDGGRQTGHRSAARDGRLLGSALYLIQPGHLGAVSLAVDHLDAGATQRYERIPLNDKPAPSQITSVSCMTAFDEPGSTRYRSLIPSLLGVIAALLGPGVALEPATGRALLTDPLDTPAEAAAAVKSFCVFGELRFPARRRSKVARLLDANPALGRLAELNGRRLTIRPRDVSLSDADWGHVYASLKQCAEVSDSGFAEVRCQGEWETRIHACG